MESLGLRLRDLFPSDPGIYRYSPTVRKRHKRAWEVRDDEFHQWRKSSGDIDMDSLPLYNAAEVEAADPSTPVYIVEGEPDVETLRREGFLATTSGGATSWHPRFVATFRGRDVVMLPDNDEAGRAYARRVKADVLPVARSYREVCLPVADGGDVSDFIESGGTVEQLDRLVADAPDLKLISPSPTGEKREKQTTGLQLTRLDDFLKEPDEAQSWLVDQLLPSGGTSILASRPKVGKSTLLRSLAVAVATGGNFLGRTCSPGPVAYLALEERRQQLRQLFRRMNVPNGAPIFIHTGITAGPTIVETIEAMIRDVGPVLIIIDPLQLLLRAPDLNDYAQVAPAMAEIMDVARRSNCHIALAHHTRKGEGTEEQSILGSTALFAGVDTGMTLSRRSDNSRVIQSRQRYGTELPNTSIRLDVDTGAVVVCGEVAVLGRDRAIAAIIEMLGGGESLTENEIRERVHFDSGRAPGALRYAWKQGLVEREGGGKKGSPYRYRRK